MRRRAHDLRMADYARGLALIAAAATGCGRSGLFPPATDEAPPPPSSCANLCPAGQQCASVLFSAGESFALGRLGFFQIGARASSLAAGDLDGDGRLDLVYADQVGGGVNVLHGDGAGTFTTGETVAADAQSMALGDLNGDGALDLLVTGAGGVSVLLNHGDGHFGAAAIVWTVPAPGSPVVADIDGDGRLDLILMGGVSNDLGLLFGEGDGTFAPERFVSAGTNILSAAVGDANGDGLPDIVAISGAGAVSVLLGAGGRAFSQAPSSTAGAGFATPLLVVLGDVNGDGTLDAALGSPSSDAVVVLLGVGDGTFLAPALVGGGNGIVSSGVTALALADLDGDGHLDLAAGNGNEVEILAGSGDGGFQPAGTFVVGAAPDSIAVADLNGDGRLDLATANDGADDVSVLLGQPEGLFPVIPSVPGLAGGGLTAVADVNGDGVPDIIDVARDVEVALGNGDGTFQDAQTAFTASPTALWGGMAVADLNGDGVLDMVLVGFVGGFVVLRGMGDGRFEVRDQEDVGPGSSAASIVLADFDGDQALDLAVASCSDREVFLVPGDGQGTFRLGAATSFPMASCPVSLVAADFNGDGRLDLVVPASTGSLGVLLGKGDGTFQPARIIGVSDLPSVVVTADLNGDARPDLIFTGGQLNSVGVVLGNGDGTFRVPRIIPVGAGPDGVAIGDLDGDGHPDLAVCSSYSDDVNVLLGKGDGTFAAARSFLTVDSPLAVIAHDLDGDGRLDLVVSSYAGVNVLRGVADHRCR
jgi:hypothetical protein